MKKIFFETLKHKFGHYLLVILCGILMVSTIYVSYAFSDSIEGIIHGQNSGIVEEMYTFINFQETYILLFILMVLVIISYIQKKSYDYVLLDTMGLKKKHRYMFIGFEYAGIIFSAWDIFDLDWSYKFIVLLGKDIQKYSDCIFECGHVPAYDQLGRILFCSVE